MNNIQELVIDKVKALSLNQQKTVLYFIDQLLTPNAIDSVQKLEGLLKTTLILDISYQRFPK